MSLRHIAVLAVFPLLLSACDRLGIADPAREAAQKEADARATGSACRHAGRAIEDCYALNPDAARSAVYAGWKEMNDYMRENKIENVKPEIAHNAPVADENASASESASASASASASGKSKK
ncbi:hypothetical protein [Undibacterium oligocarboniphilum]|uniref:Lipoprotein n=1 Tax=Undibacterium oligocarboniphilum TaxID=666702 RepID=A0A850QMF0_9BURK|nr:hypothetical protein [Undibacterium oligocarboniphilum]MBC3869521.1 hypothetical protein [Undibacterium oligocarboniphilum]NVO77900.1 hypothetical protein [Undibacterium oligocarboniphilum]